MIDLDAIKGRANSAYLLDRDDGDALFAAMGDVKALVAEVERLRAEAERERAAVVAWLRREVDDDADSACILAYAANGIESGAHRREGGE